MRGIARHFDKLRTQHSYWREEKMFTATSVQHEAIFFLI